MKISFMKLHENSSIHQASGIQLGNSNVALTLVVNHRKFLFPVYKFPREEKFPITFPHWDKSFMNCLYCRLAGNLIRSKVIGFSRNKYGNLVKRRVLFHYYRFTVDLVIGLLFTTIDTLRWGLRWDGVRDEWGCCSFME